MMLLYEFLTSIFSILTIFAARLLQAIIVWNIYLHILERFDLFTHGLLHLYQAQLLIVPNN